MGLFKDNKNESRQFFEPDIQPDILEEKKEMLSEGEQLGSDIDRVINERSNDIEHMDILDDDSVEENSGNYRRTDCYRESRFYGFY